MALHFRSPLQKAPQVNALAPQELPKFQEPDLVHLHPAIGLDSPQEIWTSPGRQAVAAGCVPHESQGVAHSQIITTKDTEVHEGKPNCAPEPAEAASVMAQFLWGQPPSAVPTLAPFRASVRLR